MRNEIPDMVEYGRTPWRRRLLVLIGIAVVSAASGCGPTWWLDPQFAERLAKEEQKPLLFYFHEWDSTQHRNMWWNVFENGQVKAEIKDTINVAVILNFYPEYRDRFNVQQPQVCVMCRPDGTKVYTTRYVNPVPEPEEFLTWLRRAKKEAMPRPASRPTTSKVRSPPQRRAPPRSDRPGIRG